MFAFHVSSTQHKFSMHRGLNLSSFSPWLRCHTRANAIVLEFHAAALRREGGKLNLYISSGYCIVIQSMELSSTLLNSISYVGCVTQSRVECKNLPFLPSYHFAWKRIRRST